MLLERGADYRPPVQIEKPIYWAAEGKPALLTLLLDHEDATGQLGKPADYDAAFGRAADEGRLENARILLQRRDIRLTAEVKYGQTALQLAAKAGHAELIKLLVEHGVLKERGAQVETAFLAAASSGHLEVLKTLRTLGKADVNARDDEGRTALYHAASARGEKKRGQRQGHAHASPRRGRGPEPREPRWRTAAPSRAFQPRGHHGAAARARGRPEHPRLRLDAPQQGHPVQQPRGRGAAAPHARRRRREAGGRARVRAVGRRAQG